MTSGPDRTKRSLFIMLGDLSADKHTEKILRILRQQAPDLHLWGVGGPAMIANGFEALYNCEDFSVLEIVDQIKRLPFYGQMAQRLLNEIEKNRPDAVLLVDYGGFNLRFATALRKRYPTLPIIYFISPQIWASRPWRVKTIAKTVTKMLTIFPFEVPIYRRNGVDARHVGHPMLSVLPEPRSVKNKEKFCEIVHADPQRQLIGVFPGSRSSEVERFMPMILSSIEQLALERDDCEFVIAHANDRLRDRIQNLLLKRNIIAPVQHAEMRRQNATLSPVRVPTPAELGISSRTAGSVSNGTVQAAGSPIANSPDASGVSQAGLQSPSAQVSSIVAPSDSQIAAPSAAFASSAAHADVSHNSLRSIVGRPIYERLHFVDGDRNYELMANSDLVWAKSGTTSLEVATFGSPMITFYRADWPSFIIWLAFKGVKWVSMANLLTGRQLVPELVQLDCRTERLVKYTRDLLDVPALRQDNREQLSVVRSLLGLGDYAANCAEEILKTIGTPRLVAEHTQANV